jgi:hypothetical protein
VIVVFITIGTLAFPISLISRNVLGMSSLILGALYFLSAIVLLIWRYLSASRADRITHGLRVMLVGTLAAFVPLILHPVVTSLWPGSARYYRVIASTYSPPLTLVLIPIAFSVAAVRSARRRFEWNVRSEEKVI